MIVKPVEPGLRKPEEGKAPREVFRLSQTRQSCQLSGSSGCGHEVYLHCACHERDFPSAKRPNDAMNALADSRSLKELSAFLRWVSSTGFTVAAVKYFRSLECISDLAGRY